MEWTTVEATMVAESKADHSGSITRGEVKQHDIKWDFLVW
jgi:hypothetical protein